MNKRRIAPVVALFAVILPLAACRPGHAASVEDVFPAEPDPLMGNYVGRWSAEEDVDPDVCAQVIPLGRNRYHVVIAAKLNFRCPPKAEADVEAKDGKILFNANGIKGACDGKTFNGGRTTGNKTFTMNKVELKSPTEGKAPPPGAVVLFDGNGFGALTDTLGWKVTDDGILLATPLSGYIRSKENYGDCQLHVEFRLSYMPIARGQARSNSGVFLNDVYEVQVLDSFGLPGYYDECGALYKVAAPMVNACYPPLAWQTYDITYRAARYDADGKLLEYPRMTVYHNGILIHKDQEIPQQTSWKEVDRLAPPPNGPGPFKLQGHGNYVQYRNIWIVPEG